MKTELLSVQIPIWLKSEVIVVARARNITLSEYVKEALKDAVIRHNKSTQQKPDDPARTAHL